MKGEDQNEDLFQKSVDQRHIVEEKPHELLP